MKEGSWVLSKGFTVQGVGLRVLRFGFGGFGCRLKIGLKVPLMELPQLQPYLLSPLWASK